MLSKNKIQLIKSLHNKKKRYELGLFIAEGHKCINELLPFFKCHQLFYTRKNLIDIDYSYATHITDDELSKISFLEQPQDSFAVFEFSPNYFQPIFFENNLILFLDSVQDPGNLGTIIRLADWYGIKHIVCSFGTVDVFNPKVIQSSMGSISRVSVYYVDNEDFFSSIPKDYSIYGTFLEGENIYNTQLKKEGLIVMGNEGNGISNVVKQYITNRIFIPPFPIDDQTIDSLNVAMATAITLSEFRRRLI